MATATATDQEAQRILPRSRYETFEAFVAAGGGEGLAAAASRGPTETIDMVDASGVRGRGGAGFPTGRKWRTILANRSNTVHTPVVVNAAEGEPGTFKDRQILRMNPYSVIEGALIAATAVDAREIVIAIKASFTREKARLTEAIDAATTAGWFDSVTIRIVDGPSSYLFGEETAMLEVIEGRPAFPRVSPPYRRGLQVEHAPTGHSAAGLHLATSNGSDEAPALMDNVETLANVASILRHGPDWYRTVGTAVSPGTIVCTITGATVRHGVGEIVMGTTLRAAIDAIGGGPLPGRSIIGVLPGVSNPMIEARFLDTPLTYEDMAAIGSGLGSAGFIVLDDATDLRQVAADVAHFLSVESCGQCEPCKRDGLAVTNLLLSAGELKVDQVGLLLDTVARGARCALAGQTERVVGSIVDDRRSHAGLREISGGDQSCRIVPIVDIIEDAALLDTAYFGKNPDWTFDQTDSGKWPVQRLADQPVIITPPHVVEGPKPSGDTQALDVVTFAGLRASHRDIESAVAQLRRATPADCSMTASKLHHLLSFHLDITRRYLHPATARIRTVDGEAIMWYPEAHEHEALRLLDRLESTDCGAPGRLIDELAADIRRYVIEVELRILPILEKNLEPDELVKLERGIEAERLDPDLSPNPISS